MAKGKKSSGKHYVSKGERLNVRRDMVKAVKKDRTTIDKVLMKMDAWKKGREVNDWRGFSFKGKFRKGMTMPNQVADARNDE